MLAKPPPLFLVQRLMALGRRLNGSAVAWSWALNGMRLAVGLVLLPIVLKVLSTADFGMYYVLLSLAALTQLVDFGIGPTVARFVTYAMGGAKILQAHGVVQAQNGATPNYELLWSLLYTTRRIYQILTLVLLLILGIWGTYVVHLRIDETSSPLLTRLAWGATLVSALWEIYSNWWEIFLKNMNEVTTAARIAVMATMIRLVLAATILMIGGGLLSLPIAGLVASFVQRHYARKRCLAILGKSPQVVTVDIGKYFRVLWPNTWRLGVHCVGGYLTVNANTAVCLKLLGLPANAQYGLSTQLIGIIAGMAGAWTMVKWPLVGQYQARQDFKAIVRLLRPRVIVQCVTFMLMAGTLLVLGPSFLGLLGTSKTMLPSFWLALLALNSFLEMHMSIWSTLIITGNRFPFLWPTLATNVASLFLSFSLIHWGGLGLRALVLGPLIAGCIFNYWYWPVQAIRSLGTSFPGFFLLPSTKLRFFKITP